MNQASFATVRGMASDQPRQFGEYLRSLRSTSKLSLRDVEGQTGVSNAFLSQIESGKVKKPSPTMLDKLARLYRVPYATLMERAGHPVPKTSSGTEPQKTPLGPISRREEQALLAYLAFLRSQGGTRPGKRLYRSRKEKPT
jgi:transcriptional regulator with XRE-family HTH domain